MPQRGLTSLSRGRSHSLLSLPVRAYKLWRRGGLPSVVSALKDRLALALAYPQWIRLNEPAPAELGEQRALAGRLPQRPLISIITPLYNTPAPILSAAIESVLRQTYDQWELCLADGSPAPGKLSAILDDFARGDRRINIVHLDRNLGIAGNTNAALALAHGEFVGFLDHDDLLAPFALFDVARCIAANPELDMLYTDEDKVSPDGRHRYSPFFKPAFSPDFLRCNNYMPHFLVIRKRLGDQLGWLRTGFEGAQDYDLILRVAERAREIAHIPRVLYHWRAVAGSAAMDADNKGYAGTSGAKALEDHLQRTGLGGVVSPGPIPTTYRITWTPTDTPLISIIIPSRDHATDLARCVDSILSRSTYPHYEIIVVENNSREQATFSLYEDLRRVTNLRVLPHDEAAFNFSLACNFGAAHAGGSILLFLNNDTEVKNGDWLERMLEYLQRPEVGVVGAKLYYPNDTIQHAGVIIGTGGSPVHAHLGAPRPAPGYYGRAVLPQDLSAVTAACLMVKASIFTELKGFDSQYQLAYGDVDLCMRVRQRGLLVVWTPYAELYHHESRTRGPDTGGKESRLLRELGHFREQWSDIIAAGDEYYNPNLASPSRGSLPVRRDRVSHAARITPGLGDGRHGPARNWPL